MRAVPRPPGPRATLRAFRLAHSRNLAALQDLADREIQAAGRLPWDKRGRPKVTRHDDLIEDIEWMLQDTRWLVEGISCLDQVAARLDLTPERLRHKLAEIDRKDILARLIRDDAA